MSSSQVLDKLFRVLPLVGQALAIYWFTLVSGENQSSLTTTEAASTKKLRPSADSDLKQSGDVDDSNFFKSLTPSETNLYRILVVLITITIVTICFCTCKYCSSKKAKRAKKYGVLATSGADLELRPLDDDEDDEEDVFNVNR